jgi:hypothetical protein
MVKKENNHLSNLHYELFSIVIGLGQVSSVNQLGSIFLIRDPIILDRLTYISFLDPINLELSR